MSQSDLQLSHAAKNDPELFLVLTASTFKVQGLQVSPHTWLRFQFYRQENQGQESQAIEHVRSLFWRQRRFCAASKQGKSQPGMHLQEGQLLDKLQAFTAQADRSHCKFKATKYLWQVWLKNWAVLSSSLKCKANNQKECKIFH